MGDATLFDRRGLVCACQPNAGPDFVAHCGSDCVSLPFAHIEARKPAIMGAHLCTLSAHLCSASWMLHVHSELDRARGVGAALYFVCKVGREATNVHSARHQRQCPHHCRPQSPRQRPLPFLHSRPHRGTQNPLGDAGSAPGRWVVFWCSRLQGLGCVLSPTPAPTFASTSEPAPVATLSPTASHTSRCAICVAGEFLCDWRAWSVR
jgi:hypothetical protein